MSKKLKNPGNFNQDKWDNMSYAEQLWEIINTAPKWGKMTVIKDNDEYYHIFSTPDRFGNLRRSDWRETIEEAEKNIGIFCGLTKERFIESARRDDWQFDSFIDITEFFDRSEYREGMKVRNVKNGIIQEITKLTKERVYFDNIQICYLNYNKIEPVIEEEEEEEMIDIDGKKYSKFTIKEALKDNLLD